MAIRDTQDALIVEQPFTSGHLRDTQDVLILEVPATAFASGHLRDTQDVLLVEWENSTAHLRVTQDPMLYEYPFIDAMFVYQAPGASVLTRFTPAYPPIRKQPLHLWGMGAVRHDSLTVDGIRQSVLDHIDTVTTLIFDWVALSDMAAWKAFEQYALGGGHFGYCPLPDYPGAIGDPTGFSDVKLLSMDWIPKFKCPHLFSLEMKLKLVADL